MKRRRIGLRPGIVLCTLSSLLLAVGCEPASEGSGPPQETPGEPEEAAGPPAEVGRLVIVGGGLADDNEDVYRSILEGREGEGPLCVVPTASSRPRESMEGYVSTFDRHGGEGTATGVFLTTDDPAAARSPETADRLRGCSGIFFTGGDQSRIVEVFLPGGDTTQAFRAVRERFLTGAVVAGSSAGAAIMSNPMIAGGSSRGALEHGVRAREGGDGVWLRDGFGFFGPGLVDQHFLARGRIGRLLVASIRVRDVDWGFGVDENTALVVDGADARIEGASGVLWIDASDAVPESGDEGATGVRLHLLGAGDQIDLAAGAVTAAGEKDPLEGGALGVEQPSEPFADYAFLEFLTDFAAAGAVEAGFAAHGFRFAVEKLDGFRAGSYGPGGVEGAPRGFFAGPIGLSFVRR